MAPKAALPPAIPFTLQVTPVFAEPVTVALNCCVSPLATLGLLGESASDVSVAALTVRVSLALTLPSVAVIWLIPAARVEARPSDPDTLLMVATDVAEGLKLLEEVLELAPDRPGALTYHAPAQTKS